MCLVILVSQIWEKSLWLTVLMQSLLLFNSQHTLCCCSQHRHRSRIFFPVGVCKCLSLKKKRQLEPILGNLKKREAERLSSIIAQTCHILSEIFFFNPGDQRTLMLITILKKWAECSSSSEYPFKKNTYASLTIWVTRVFILSCFFKLVHVNQSVFSYPLTGD